MIKFLISFLILLYLFSCQEIKEKKITSTVNKNIKKIEKIIENTDLKKNSKNRQNKKSNSIFYYVGEPYFIEGVKYIPEENYNYSEIGLSTFYGKELHNIKTINNDVNKVTELLGRHKTLPIPSMVKITNLDNGLSINIKIIDRHDDNASLIQVSRKVAQLLGFYKNKIATVRVEILSDASKQWKSVSNSLNEPKFDETISSAPTQMVSISDIDNTDLKNSDEEKISYSSTDSEPIELSSEEVDNYSLYLKVFNFKNYSDVQSIMTSLSDDIKFTSERNGSSYDLILGPISNIKINNLVSYFISKGYKETKIIIN